MIYIGLTHPIGEPARQSVCKARPWARHTPLAAYAAPVVDGITSKRTHLESSLAHKKKAYQWFGSEFRLREHKVVTRQQPVPEVSI